MQGNDISEYAAIAQGVVFDGLLATPPEGAKAILETIQRRRNNWDAVFRLWEPNDMPLRALSDSVNRLGLGTDIYTFTDADAVDAIDRWLVRKGINCPVYFYESPELLEALKKSLSTVLQELKGKEKIIKTLNANMQSVAYEKSKGLTSGTRESVDMQNLKTINLKLAFSLIS